jgi:hypothetical protein
MGCVYGYYVHAVFWLFFFFSMHSISWEGSELWWLAMAMVEVGGWSMKIIPH